MQVAKSRRAEDAIARLAGRGLDLVSLWRACSEIVAETVPLYLAPCWFTVDPASLLMTSHFQEGLPVLPAEWAAQEYAVDDVNQLSEVARSPSGISTLHDATNGDPASSPRWHANMAYGGDQEMISALLSRNGQVWGSLGAVSTESPTSPSSTRRSWPLFAASAHCSPTARDAPCCWVRPPRRKGRKRPA